MRGESLLITIIAAVGALLTSDSRASGDVVALAPLAISDAAAFDVAAGSISMDGANLAMGVRGRDDGGTNRGGVYLFKSVATGWSQFQKVTPASSVSREEFGDAVELSGDWLSVGARKSDRDGLNSGSAWIFQSNGVNFVEMARIPSPTPAVNGAFGCAIALDPTARETLVVGAQRELVDGVAAGVVHVFERAENGLWSAAVRLTASGVPTENDEFGHVVAIDGGRIAIGMPGDDERAVNAGSVHVFVRVKGVWAFETKIVAPSAQLLAEFGSSLSLSENRLAIGSCREDSTIADAGRVHLYARNEDGWMLEQSIDSPTPAIGGEFGCSVSLDDDALLIGADRELSGGIPIGKSHFFRRSSSASWLAVATIRSTQPQSDEFGGATVALSQGKIVMGVPLRTATQPFQGMAFATALSSDCDGNLIPDLAELAAGAADCDGNQIPDSCDIAAGATDEDNNGVPDLCEIVPCIADIIETGSVDGLDLAALLSTWGTNGGSFPRADVNQDGIVDASDLAVVLGGWGPCPN